MACCDLLKKAVENLIWMVERIHQAYHLDPYHLNPNNPLCGWKSCHKGVCGSMEHMLAQAGFTKDLEITEIRP